MSWIVFEQVNKIVDIFGVIDSHDLESVALVLNCSSEGKSADAAETINTNSDWHLSLILLYIL